MSRAWAGLAGLAVVMALALMLSATRERLVQSRAETAAARAAHQLDLEAVRRATAEARAADAEKARKVAAAQTRVTERIVGDYQARIDDVRARAQRLRDGAPAGDGVGGGAALSAAGDAPRAPDAAPGEDRLPAAGLVPADALIATEQAIQLDSLIDWVAGQHQAAAPQ